MSVTVSWYDTSQTILQYTISGDWNYDEFYTALEQGRVMSHSVPHEVCVIQDYSNTGKLPPGAFTHTRNIVKSRPDNVGLVVFVTNNPIMKPMYNIARTIVPQLEVRYRLAPDTTTAIHWIQEWIETRHTVSIED